MFNLPDLEATAYETRGYKSRLVYGSHKSGSRELSAWSGCLYNEKQMGAAFAERIPYGDLTLVVAASQANCWAPSDRALSSKQWSTKAVQQTRHSGSRI